MADNKTKIAMFFDDMKVQFFHGGTPTAIRERAERPAARVARAAGYGALMLAGGVVVGTGGAAIGAGVGWYLGEKFNAHSYKKGWVKEPDHIKNRNNTPPRP